MVEKLGNGLLIAKGKVFTGLGEGSRFVKLLWFRRQVKEKFNFDPYPGTLNLLLEDENIQTMLELYGRNAGYEIIPKDGFSTGRLYKALIAGAVFGAVIKPCIPNYPKNILEVIAPFHLRSFLKLKDGDIVEVKVWFR